jgi:hypothetical protein
MFQRFPDCLDDRRNAFAYGRFDGGWGCLPEDCGSLPAAAENKRFLLKKAATSFAL